jgi:phage tail sheath protein FI
MPQYLSPGVYVEEIDTGSKPIEGVSTSIGAMVGMAERGPVNVPILLGSIGDYNDWFGGYLDPEIFVNNTCFLPHAVEGFFGNGGQEMYALRVLEPLVAVFANTQLFGLSATNPAPTELLAPTATSPATSLVYVIDSSVLAVGDWVQVGNGSTSDFAQVVAPTGTANEVTLRPPLVYGYDNTSGTAVTVNLYTLPATAATFKLQADVAIGSTTLILDSAAGIVANTVLRLYTGAAGNDEEFAFATGPGVQLTASPATYQVTLAAPTQIFHPMGTGPNTIDSLGTLGAAVQTTSTAAPGSTVAGGTMAPGSAVLFLVSTAGFVANDLAQVTDGTHSELRRIGTLQNVSFDPPSYVALSPEMLIQGVTLNDFTAATPPGANADKSLTSDLAAGSVVLVLNDRSGLAVGNVLRIGFTSDPTREYIQIAQLPNMPVSGPSPGQVLLVAPVANARSAPSQVHLQIAPPPESSATGPTVTTALPVAQGAQSMTVTDATGLSATSILQITPDGETFYYVLANAAPSAVTPKPISLSATLANPHLAGEPVTVRAPLLTVKALDQGGWGNRLRVAVESGPPLVQSTLASFQDSTHIRIVSSNGVEAGTVLQLTDSSGNVSSLKVIAVDRQNNLLITLDPSTALPVSAAAGDAVVSIEFQIDVYLLRQPDPSVPSRNNTVLDFEIFPQLSMDPRHSRYVDKVIGTTWTPGLSPPVDDDGNPLRKSDMRSEGGSSYIRIHDTGTTAAKTSIRSGPVALVDSLPTGGTQPARMPLVGGDDGVGAVSYNTYVGSDDVEPELRTGMYALRNQEDISIIACPGRTDVEVQAGLITQCEEMLYRFAILDGPSPPDDTITDVQIQRQAFDTKYAALYHPWLVIPDPFPMNVSSIINYPIPPSGHVMGVYARVDTLRGVHKAPANELISGIIGLQRRLNKTEQDVLNPYPVNINVIRDFRKDDLGLRIYGARVITSDPDWKYVNVRRLIIFIEASLNQGLQWVVFEPNDQSLWARVRRTISLFLTQVWRSGALQGSKPEEAFFVNCGLDTMTQTDIQNGRLICVIGVAPVYPAEFVIVRIGLWTGGATN